jgi:hypothetical protein
VALLRIELQKGETRRYHSLFHRADGVTIDLEGGSYNRVGGPHLEVPHDLAHLIVEDELDLTMGVWGVLANGGLFRLATVTSGRRRPHASARAEAVTKEAAESLMQAEVLVGAACSLVAADRLSAQALRNEVGERYDTPTIAEEPLRRVHRRLRDGSRDWAALEPGGQLELSWRERR